MATSGIKTVVGATLFTSSADVIYRTLTIPATTKQTYTLKLSGNSIDSLPVYNHNATYSDQVLTVPYGTSFEISYEAEPHYTSGEKISGIVTDDDLTIVHSKAIAEKFPVYAMADDGITLTIMNGTEIVNDGDLVDYDAVLTCIYNQPAEEEFEIKNLDTGNCIVNITQSENQTIFVLCNGFKYTSSFIAYKGDVFEAYVTADTGYEAGNLNITEGTVTENLNISATSPEKLMPVTFAASAGTTIKVKKDSVKLASGAYVKTGSTITYDVSYDDAYENDGIDIGDYLFTVDQSEGQTIAVTVNGVEHTSSFVVNEGDTWTATITADKDCEAGILSETSGVITGSITLSASPAKIPYKIITIDSSNASNYPTLVDGINFEVKERYIQSGAMSYNKDEGHSKGFITFTTPSVFPDGCNYVTVECYANSEDSDYGYVYITPYNKPKYVNNSYDIYYYGEPTTNGIMAASSGWNDVSSVFVSSELAPDTTYTLAFGYAKNYSSNYYNDRFYIRSIRFPSVYSEEI